MKINNKGFTFVEILAVIVIIGLLTGISIAAFSRYKENAIKSDYEALAKSSYNAMEEYMMSHPYDDKVSLETLENENLLSNRKDPGSKEDCTGTVEVSKNSGTSGKLDDGTYKVHLCCVSVQKTYTYPGGKSTDLEDTSNCEYVPEDEPIVPPTPGTTYTLHYNDNGGSGCSSKSITKNAGEAWGSLCSPTRSGYTFKGWKNGSETVTSSSIANGNITVTASWSANTTTKYTLKYNDNGGSGCSTKTITRNKNEAWGSLCTPKRTGYTFNGWYDGSTKYTSSTKATKNVTVKANWTSNTAPKYTCAAGKYLPKNKTSCATCTSGNYCKGGTWPKSTITDQGLTPCPTGYKNSPTGSKTINQCYMKVADGRFVKTKNASSTELCSSGTYKAAHNVYYGNTSSCNTCPNGYKNSANGSKANTQCYMKVPDGRFVKTKNATSSTACTSGTYKAAHNVYYGNTSSCGNCPSGYPNSNEGSTAASKCYRKNTATFTYLKGAETWNGSSSATIKRNCNQYYGQANCQVTAPSHIDIPGQSHCSKKYNNLIINKGWNKTKNSATGGVGTSAKVNITGNVTYYSVYLPNSNYINKNTALKVDGADNSHLSVGKTSDGVTCGEGSPNVYNRSQAKEDGFNTLHSYTLENAYIYWSGTWLVNTENKPYDENYLYIVGKPIDSKGNNTKADRVCKQWRSEKDHYNEFANCPSSAYIKAIQLTW